MVSLFAGWSNKGTYSIFKAMTVCGGCGYLDVIRWDGSQQVWGAVQGSASGRVCQLHKSQFLQHWRQGQLRRAETRTLPLCLWSNMEGL